MIHHDPHLKCINDHVEHYIVSTTIDQYQSERQNYYESLSNFETFIEVLDELMKSQREQRNESNNTYDYRYICLFIAYKVIDIQTHKEFDKFLKVLQEVQKQLKKPDLFLQEINLDFL